MPLVILLAKRYWKQIAALLLLAALVTIPYLYGTHTANQKCAAREHERTLALTEQLRFETKRASDATSAYLSASRTRATKTRQVIKEVIREVEKPIYASCPVPVDAIVLINKARGYPPKTTHGADAEVWNGTEAEL